MAFTDTQIRATFDLLVGSDLELLTVDEQQKLDWFNEGVNRLASAINRYKPNYVDIAWSLGDRTLTLPTDFIEIDKIVTDTGYVPQAWRAFGTVSKAKLKIDDSDGATQAGAARVYYWSQWPLLTYACAPPALASTPYCDRSPTAPYVGGFEQLVTLVHSEGAWTGDPTITFAYQWQITGETHGDFDLTSATWGDLVGTSAENPGGYQLTTITQEFSWFSYFIRCKITATNSCASTVVYSSPNTQSGE